MSTSLSPNFSQVEHQREIPTKNKENLKFDLFELAITVNYGPKQKVKKPVFDSFQ